MKLLLLKLQASDRAIGLLIRAVWVRRVLTVL